MHQQTAHVGQASCTHVLPRRAAAPQALRLRLQQHRSLHQWAAQGRHSLLQHRQEHISRRTAAQHTASCNRPAQLRNRTDVAALIVRNIPRTACHLDARYALPLSQAQHQTTQHSTSQHSAMSLSANSSPAGCVSDCTYWGCSDQRRLLPTPGPFARSTDAPTAAVAGSAGPAHQQQTQPTCGASSTAP
jgi:hypothetical protein